MSNNYQLALKITMIMSTVLCEENDLKKSVIIIMCYHNRYVIQA